MEELEDEAGGAYAELESGGGVVDLAAGVRTPLDVEADQAVVRGFRGGDPGGGQGGVGGDGGLDLVGVEGDVEEVVV